MELAIRPARIARRVAPFEIAQLLRQRKTWRPLTLRRTALT
jgi:hypothetical protein